MDPKNRSLGSRTRWSAALAPATVVVASIAAGGLVLARLVLSQQTPVWDEAEHALKGALIAHDLRDGDLLALAFDTYIQVWWPPLHSWLLAGAFLVTGPSMEVARGVSVVSYVLLAPTLFLLARIIAPRYGNVAGCLAAALALTSPGIIAFSARSMLELPGLLAISATMLVYGLLERAPDADDRAQALLGLSVVLTYLTKTHFGILVGIATVLAKLFAVRFRLKRLLTKQNLYAILPLVLFLVIWFAWPVKIAWTWDALVNRPSLGRDTGPGGLDSTLTLVKISGSWWMSAFLWTGLLLAWKIRARPGVTLPSFLALTLYVIAAIHHTKGARHMLPVLPAMFVLTGVAGASAWAWLRARGPRGTAVAGGALALIVVLHASTLTRYKWKGGADNRPVILEYVSRSARSRGNAPYLVLGTKSSRPGPPVFDWMLVSEGLMPVTMSSSVMDQPMERWLRGEIRTAPIPERFRRSMSRLLYRYNKRSDARSLHFLLWSRETLWGRETRSTFETGLATTVKKDRTRTIIAITGSADTTDYGLIVPGIAENGFREVTVREFPRPGTQVHEYRRP